MKLVAAQRVACVGKQVVAQCRRRPVAQAGEPAGNSSPSTGLKNAMRAPAASRR
jgi:hypothetical protein